jgi:hypothetical protein
MLMRVALGSLALAAALAAGGCAEWRYQGTDGTSWPGGTVFEGKLASWVVVSSAKHDLPCDTPKITGEGSLEVEWVVEGCGQRVTYRYLPSGHTWKAALVSRIAMNGCVADCPPP